MKRMHPAVFRLPDFGLFSRLQRISIRGIGAWVKYLASRNGAWVLNSWQLEVKRFPKECEFVTVETWASGFHRFHGDRNFLMKDEGGETIAYANLIWVYMDLDGAADKTFPRADS